MPYEIKSPKWEERDGGRLYLESPMSSLFVVSEDGKWAIDSDFGSYGRQFDSKEDAVRFGSSVYLDHVHAWASQYLNEV